MKSVIIASASAKLSSSLESLFRQMEMPVCAMCKSGSELLSIQSNYEDAVLVCGPLKDMPAIYISKILPDSWDMLLLVSSSQPFPYYVSNVTAINMPINKREFFSIVNGVVNVQSQSFGTKSTAKQNRSEDDRSIIDQAKSMLMKKRGMSEGDAHKYLQRYSMNIGVSMSEVASRVLNDN